MLHVCIGSSPSSNKRTNKEKRRNFLICKLLGITYSGLEGGKCLFRQPTGRNDLDHVETHCLGQRPALSHDHGVTLAHTETGRQVGRDVCMTLLIPLVFLHKVKIVAAHNDGLVHFCGMHNPRENPSANGNITRERALLVNVFAWTTRVSTSVSTVPTSFVSHRLHDRCTTFTYLHWRCGVS